MKMIALIVMVAILLEALIEYARTFVEMIESKEYKKAILQGSALVGGIALAFIFKLQLFNVAMTEFYPEIQIDPTIDMVLTGILFSRGSNYFSNIVTKLTQKPQTIEVLNEDDVEPETEEDDFDEDMEGMEIKSASKDEKAEG